MPEALDLDRIRSILVVKLSSLGDIVHVTPCLRALRQRCPQARIVMAVDRPFAGVVRANPYVDELVLSEPDAPGKWGKLLQIRRALAAYQRDGFDLAIDFQGQLRSACWVYGSRARTQAGLGRVRPGWRFRACPDRNQHAIQVGAAVLRALGVPVADLNPEVFFSATAAATARRIILQAGVAQDFVLINPFSRWRSKTWPPERYAALMVRIRRELGVQPVLVGSPDEAALAGHLMTSLTPGTAVSLVGRLSLEQAIAVYSQARLMVTGDSGPMHIAAARGIPVVALFGPTWPERTGPWGTHHCVVQAKRPPHHHAYREADGRKYMEAIAVDDVFRAVARLHARSQCA